MAPDWARGWDMVSTVAPDTGGDSEWRGRCLRSVPGRCPECRGQAPAAVALSHPSWQEQRSDFLGRTHRELSRELPTEQKHKDMFSYPEPVATCCSFPVREQCGCGAEIRHPISGGKSVVRVILPSK